MSWSLIHPHYHANLHSCLTLQVESFHAMNHLKNNSLLHMLEHSQAFGNTVKEMLKRQCQWAVHYFTKRQSYYPVPKCNIKFADIPKLDPLPPVQMCNEERVAMREWALAFGKTGKQRNARQETCSYKAGTLPLYAYENLRKCTIMIQ